MKSGCQRLHRRQLNDGRRGPGFGVRSAPGYRQRGHALDDSSGRSLPTDGASGPNLVRLASRAELESIASALQIEVCFTWHGWAGILTPDAVYWTDGS